MSKQTATGPDAKKAAKILADFVHKGKDRPSLQSVYHDKKSGVAVASDGRALIATKHGFDPDAVDVQGYPDWRQIVPSDKVLVRSATVNPAELAKTCKNAIRLAKATGYKGYVIVALRMGGGVATIDAKYMIKVAEAMDANGITELRTGADVGCGPIVAKNEETTLAFMPLRCDGRAVDVTAGRRHGANFVISADDGRIISAPDRTDAADFSREHLDALRKGLDEYRRQKVEEVKGSPVYARIRQAQKDGLTDPKTAYCKIKVSGPDWDGQTEENRAWFAKWLKTTDADGLAEAMAAYSMERDKTPCGRKSREAEIARVEKRIAAEDEIDALMGAQKPVKDETPAPAGKTADAKKQAPAKPAAAPAKKQAPVVEAVKTAADPALWNPDEWKRLTSAKSPEMARVCVISWAAAHAPKERAELVLMADDYAYIFNEGRKEGRADATPSQALVDFRAELDEELAERITRAYGAAKWDAVRACL